MSILLWPLRAAAGVIRSVIKPRSAPAPSRPAAKATPGSSAPVPRAGKHDAALTDLITRRPGLTVAQAASELDLQATSLYPVIRRLQTRGTLDKRGRELHPA